MEKFPLEMEGEDFPVRFRDSFSVRYIQSAALLCRLGYSIERDNKDPSPEILLRHEAFILNSLLSSVAFLESAVNELYADAADEESLFQDETTESLLRAIAERWRNEKNFDRAPVIEKYQRILSIAEKAVFDEREPGFSNVRQLVLIRNYLMHYRREWVPAKSGMRRDDDSVTVAESFEKSLKTKFAPNPFAHKKRPFFPDQCLGHGCSEWAVVNCMVFADEFFRRLGLPAPYDAIKKELTTR